MNYFKYRSSSEEKTGTGKDNNIGACELKIIL